MEKKIKQLFNQDILRQAAERYGIREDPMIELNEFQNFVYSSWAGAYHTSERNISES